MTLSEKYVSVWTVSCSVLIECWLSKPWYFYEVSLMPNLLLTKKNTIINNNIETKPLINQNTTHIKSTIPYESTIRMQKNTYWNTFWFMAIGKYSSIWKVVPNRRVAFRGNHFALKDLSREPIKMYRTRGEYWYLNIEDRGVGKGRKKNFQLTRLVPALSHVGCCACGWL